MAFDTESKCAVSLLKSLQSKYLIADGLMLMPDNEHLVKMVVTEINSEFDQLMVACVKKNDDDILPGTFMLKISVVEDKLKFDRKVNDWLKCVTSNSLIQSAVPSP